MPRAAFTIVLNGLHHFKHNDYANYVLNNFDYWVVVEGAAMNTGSTRWCSRMPDEYHKNGRSIDGTLDYLSELKNKYKNLHMVIGTGLWLNKDHQVNAGINELKKHTNEAMLWEIDADEQWNITQIEAAERALIAANAKSGWLWANHYVGHNLVCRGEWGDGPHRRLWKWHGELFEKHEPPVLMGGGEPHIILPQRFEHYAYYFECDVKFKDKWYGGHQGIYDRWLSLQKETVFPQPISRLFGDQGYGRSKTTIVRI